MSTQTIMASLDEKMLANADRYFTTDLETLIDEIVQNARRAGATTLKVERRDTALIIEDDGRGLPAERAGVLLRLGGSANTQAVETDENAAGMGFFALARYGVTVRSHDWEMTIPPEAFVSKAPATLTRGHPHLQGMRLTIPGLERANKYHQIIDGEIFVAATRFTGLRLHVTGCTGTTGWHEPKDFLTAYADRAEMSAERRIHGVTIKVCRGARVDRGLTVNFFGKIIQKGSRIDLFPAETIAYIDTTGQNPTVRSTKVATAVLIDVHDTRALKLQLPQRANLVEDEGFHRIEQEAMSILQDLLMEPGTVNAIPLDSPLRQGRGAGIAPPQIVVQTALQTENDYVETTRMSRDGGLVRADGSTIPLDTVIGGDLSNFYIALLRTERAESVLGSNGILHASDLDEAFGEGSYRKITAVQIDLRIEGEESTIDLHTPDMRHDEIDFVLMQNPEVLAHTSRIVDDLALTLTLTGPAGTERLTVPIPAFFHCCGRDVQDPVVFLVPNGEDDVLTTMMDGIRWYNEDEDGDYNTAYDYIYGQYNALIAKLTGSSEAAFLGDLQEQIEILIRRHFGCDPSGRRFAISVEAENTAHSIRVVNRSLTLQDAPVAEAA